MITREHENLIHHTTFAVPATCPLWVETSDDDSDEDLVSFLASNDIRPGGLLVLGAGSNVLFKQDYPGIIIHPTSRSFTVKRETPTDVLVRAAAGLPLDELVAWSVANGYGGLENLSGIPGTVGATPVQNVGAYGVEIGTLIDRVEAIDVKLRKRVSMPGKACEFGYRDSYFKHKGKDRFIITRVTYRLSKAPVFNLKYNGLREAVERDGTPTLLNIRAAILRLRAARLPDVKKLPNAGSFFKNPFLDERESWSVHNTCPHIRGYFEGGYYTKYPAAAMIEEAGWKGRAIGRAAVYDKHALVLVNLGGATGAEISHLANEIRKSVFIKFGIWIKYEVNVI